MRLRLLGLAGALFAVSACSSEGGSNYAQIYQILRQSVAATFGSARVTRDQAASIPYASLGFRVEGQNQSIVVLATDTDGELLWTSAAHVVIATRDGRIVRSIGLGHDLAAMTGGQSTPPLAPAAALHGPFSSTRLEDFPELGIYGMKVTCRTAMAARQTIRILDQQIPTIRVDESCASQSASWSFVDHFWIDPKSGMPWRTQQHIHPKGGSVETEIFRPPS